MTKYLKINVCYKEKEMEGERGKKIQINETYLKNKNVFGK